MSELGSNEGDDRIERLLDKWSSCWCGPQLAEDHDPRARDCPHHGSDDCRHMAEGFRADLQRLLAVPSVCACGEPGWTHSRELHSS